MTTPNGGEAVSSDMTRADLEHARDRLLTQRGVDAAVIAALRAEGVIDRSKIANLEVALINARQIGAAIGILMASQKLTEQAAFEELARASQAGHEKLRHVAAAVILTGILPQTPTRQTPR